MTPMTDAEQRREALDPARSFIVQAPAGSGKTELLVQRFLVLLARVVRPEQVVALTFTRKAAAEMRQRILNALGAPEPADDVSENVRQTWDLAQKVLARDAQHGWQLADNPARLSIQTIDAFCAKLARQMPLSSGLGALPEMVENADALYREAARETILHLQADTHWSKAIEILLEHLDNDWPKLETLIVPMLARRDQWLRVGEPDRVRCEAALTRVISEAVSACREALPDEFWEQLLTLARFAAENLNAQKNCSEISHCHELKEIPADDLPAWLGLAKLLLTNEGAWRKREGINATLGFPAGKCDGMKTRIGRLLDALCAHDDLRTSLHALRILPAAAYTDEQWRVLEALIVVLKLAAAELSLVFQKRGQVDFVAVAHASLSALGAASEPSDIALALDSRIVHLLVDEFQDTSVSQYDLIARLTAGWERQDGRTLFLVGDPMQSIYGFRRAEVGLFLKARQFGVGGVELVPLTLSLNFRSHSGLVEWVNQTFAQVLPPREDIAEGAVCFSAALAADLAPEGFEVNVHPSFEKDGAAEARQVTALAREARAAKQSVGVLVRSRKHLALIAPQLKDAGLRFKAVEIESLDETQVVRDLTSLTRAYFHLADRIAWLAILRAPWCGLTLADVEVLAQGERTIWENIRDKEVVARLSADGHARLKRLAQVFEIAFAQRGRANLRGAIEGIWLSLGGPACAQDETELGNANLYLEQLEKQEDFFVHDESLFAAPDPQADNELQLMTIHKAKGLEFDVVIVPGLGRHVRGQEPSLLMWAERASPHGVDLLFAPIPSPSGKGEAIYQYLREREKRRNDLEESRLLYVAVTRAKKSLHLLGHARASENGAIEAVKSSPLRKLWPAVGARFANAAPKAGDAPPVESKQSMLRRLPLSWTLPAPPANVRVAAAQSPASESVLDYFWVTDITRHIGNVVHQTLARIVRDGIERWPASRITMLRKRHAHALAQLGVPGTELDGAASEVERALVQTLSEARGRWILDPRHREDKSEYALTGIDSGQIVNVVLDRTFVDEKGTRWIIDFKTGTHRGGDVESFLNNEQLRYAPQLERYARILRKLDSRPIRLGLYFPLLQGWREWEAS